MIKRIDVSGISVFVAGDYISDIAVVQSDDSGTDTTFVSDGTTTEYHDPHRIDAINRVEELLVKNHIKESYHDRKDKHIIAEDR